MHAVLHPHTWHRTHQATRPLPQRRLPTVPAAAAATAATPPPEAAVPPAAAAAIPATAAAAAAAPTTVVADAPVVGAAAAAAAVAGIAAAAAAGGTAASGGGVAAVAAAAAGTVGSLKTMGPGSAGPKYSLRSLPKASWALSRAAPGRVVSSAAVQEPALWQRPRRLVRSVPGMGMEDGMHAVPSQFWRTHLQHYAVPSQFWRN
eukprot:gene7384-biopygen7553